MIVFFKSPTVSQYKMIEKKYTKIYFRVFPMEKMIWDYLKILDDHRTIYIRYLQELAKSKENVVPTFWTFRTDYVFFNNTQKQIYDKVVPEILDNVSQGHDGILMAYGQTGTGKSLSINGVYTPFDNRGILPRIASDLFHRIQAKHIKMCIQVSYVEFSRTNINDLLKSYPNHLYSLKDVKKVKVKNLEDAFKIIFRGEGRKLYSENNSYASHACSSIFTFYISTKNKEMQENSISKCKFHIIDLAGADTVGNFSCLFKNSQEIGAANLAKTQLEQFFLVLCSDIPEHIKIKQRLNPMIHFLGDSLNKTSILRLIGHIRVSREDLLVTISMLRFGELIGGLKSTRYQMSIEPEVNQEKVDSLQKELDKLKLESKYNALLLHQDLSKSINEERFAHIERTVKEYLENKITQLTLLNVCDINIALEILKMIYKQCENEKNNKEKESSVTKTKRLSSSSAHSKIPSKSSKASNKTSSSSDHVAKRNTEEKLRERSSSSANKDKASLRARSKTSSSSLLKRPATTRRKSSSSASIHSKTEERILKPEIPPEYDDAWNDYLTEKNDDYVLLLQHYEKNEAAAKNVYRTYLTELEKLTEITTRVDKHKTDLMMAKMTRDFQKAYKNDGNSSLSEFEERVMNELQKAEQEQMDQQELALKCQTELKAYINICKDVKRDLQNSFNKFCEEKYRMPVMNLEETEVVTTNIVEALSQEAEHVVQEMAEEDDEAKMFERLKPLIEIEKRKKKLYQLKHREWSIY